MPTVPLRVQLTNGITQGTSDVDARKPGINYCENLDFKKAGEVTGRPGYTVLKNFGLRSINSATRVTEPDTGDTDIGSIPYDFSGLFKLQTQAGENPGLAANGRVWSWDNNRWSDRLYSGTARVKRVAEFVTTQGQDLINSANSPGLAAAGYNFMPTSSNWGEGSPMLSAKGSIQNRQGAGFLFGSACSVLSVNGMYHCVVGNNAANNLLFMQVRHNEDQTITTYNLKADCRQGIGLSASDTMPACCTDDQAENTFGVPTLWIMYNTTTLGTVTLLRVNAATGAIIAQANYIAPTNTSNMSISSNSFANQVVAALNPAVFTPGIVCRLFNSTTCANNVAGNANFDLAVPGGILAKGPLSIGFVGLSGTAMVAYQVGPGGGPTAQYIVVGKYVPLAPSATVVHRLGWNDSTLLGRFDFAHHWVGLKGPASASGSFQTRMVLGVYHTRNMAANGLPALVSDIPPANWFALDYTDVAITDAGGEVKPQGTVYPGILAMGPVDASATPVTWFMAPDSAIPSRDRTSYRFLSRECKSFSVNGGADGSVGLNEVELVNVRAASIGSETVISGSVPHSICGGYSFETMFVQVAPEILVTTVAGGGLAIGSYTLQALWKYIDDNGLVHRSAPSQIIKTGTIPGAGNFLRVKVQNLVLHQRESGSLYIELYCTLVNPTSTSQKYLISTVKMDTAVGTTQIDVGNGLFPSVTLPLYTLNGAIMQNLPVSADGGVATVNRRMWLSDGVSVFASKKFKVGVNEGPAWNDEGPLTLTIPSPAGRILSLEAMDDKLLIFCENGVFMTQGEGPEDTGLGTEFLFPVKISDMGVSNERGTVATVHGVAMHTLNNTTSALAGYGGVYLVDRSLNLTPLNINIQDSTSGVLGDLGAVPFQLAYVKDRDLLAVHKVNQARRIYVLDMRADPAPGQWSVWTNPNKSSAGGSTGGVAVSVEGVGGVLWGLYDNSGTVSSWLLGSFDAIPGSDDGVAFTMLLRTNHIFADGADGAGWSRVRSITPVGSLPQYAPVGYTETLAVTQDQGNSSSPVQTSVFSYSPSTTWPVNRPAMEYRLPNQKCSEIQVTLTAKPAIARWSELRLDIMPKRAKSPASQRN